MNASHRFFISPGEASIDILEAVKKGLASGLQRVRPQPQYLQKLHPNLKRKVSVAALPAKHYSLRKPITVENKRAKAKRIRRELIDAGATLYGLMKSESRHLPKILHDNEHIMGVIYGQHSTSSAMLVATSERIIYLDTKPMAELFDEVSYEVVSGIEFDIHLFYATVVLHTPVKNYDFKWVNMRCAEKFARYIETQRLEHEQKEEPPVIETVAVRPREDDLEFEDMAGYYWLPTDEEERRKIQKGV